MKEGTFIIINKDGKLVAAVRRADSQEIELEIDVTPEIQALNGKYCEYNLKGDKQVIVEGKSIFHQRKVEIKQTEKMIKPSISYLKNKVEQSMKPDKDFKDVSELKLPQLNDSFDPSKSCIPKDTRNAIIKAKPQNFYLKLNQLARFDFKDNKEKEEHFSFFNSRDIKTSYPEKRLVVPPFEIKPDFGDLFGEPTQLSDRLNSSAKSIFQDQNHLLELSFKPEWRFVTGLGGYSVYETGITLHHIYGIPYIPASSVKGVLRSWIIFSCFDNDEEKAIGDETFCKVFGCPSSIKIDKKKYHSVFKEARRGNVTFFDAFPYSEPKIVPDIMNPHYPQWYGGKSAPVDTDSPNPIYFLTVKDTTFKFLLGSRTCDIVNHKFWNDETLSWWLENALSEHGIGAKTAVGYGYMKKV